jgi:ligand-binding SRPBCC domain-containing protein
MNDSITLRFESKLHSSAECVWEWITSIDGISNEMWPYFRMSVPRGVRSLTDLDIRLGERMFRSYIFLFSILPIDFSDMTLVELDSGLGFVERSPMGSMKFWRHERRIVPTISDSRKVILLDELTFQPRLARRFVGWFIKHVFTHRHNVLRRHFNGA